MEGRSIDAVPEVARQHGERLRSALEAGTDRPAAVRRVLMPNASGGPRPLGLPTVLDRVMQHAIAQVIGRLFEPHVSPPSDGFRPGRGARMALAEMEEAHRDGLRYAVDGDRQRCFDTVPHRVLRNRLARRSTDRRVRRRMSRDWRAGGIRPDGSRAHTRGGVPPGGPLSPLRATVRRDARDAERERRGLRFARSADDFRLFVRSQAAAPRGGRRLSRVIAGRWRLRIHWTKRKAARLRADAFLGFEWTRGQLRWPKAAVQRVKARIREITNRSHGPRMAARLEALQRSVTGGLTSVGHRHRDAERVEWAHGRRRRVRLGSWKPWQRPRTRQRHLLALGLARDDVPRATRRRTGSWRMAGNRLVPRALTHQWVWAPGVPHMRPQWIALHDGASAP